MRHLRAALVAGFATAALALPSSALAQIDSVSVSEARLGPEGARIAVTLTVQCEPGWVFGFAVIDVAQSTGKRLAVGQGNFSGGSSFGDPCTGAPQSVVVTVRAFGQFAFKQGRATILSGSVAVFNPLTDEQVGSSIEAQPIRIRK